MGRAPCCEKQGLKRGPWSPEEDKLLVDYIQAHGYGTWRSLPRLAGLLRCGKSCRLRWTNYLRPDIKRGAFTPEEEKSIVQLHAIVGNKWSTIAANLLGRTDNEIKNYWNTHLKKCLGRMAGINPDTYTTTASATSSSTALSPEPSTDFFLRIWNSPIGEDFRKPVSTSASCASEVPPPPPHTSPLPSSNVTTSNETAAAAAEVTSEEEDSYRDYFNFAAGDDLGFFFEGQMESFYSPSPLFSDDAS